MDKVSRSFWDAVFESLKRLPDLANVLPVGSELSDFYPGLKPLEFLASEAGFVLVIDDGGLSVRSECEILFEEPLDLQEMAFFYAQGIVANLETEKKLEAFKRSIGLL